MRQPPQPRTILRSRIRSRRRNVRVAAAVLGTALWLFLAACSSPAEVVVASVEGSVTVDGEPVENVTVQLAGGGNSYGVRTDSFGSFGFIGTLELTHHTLTISGFPPDATFPFTSTVVEIESSPFETKVDFIGTTDG